VAPRLASSDSPKVWLPAPHLPQRAKALDGAARPVALVREAKGRRVQAPAACRNVGGNRQREVEAEPPYGFGRLLRQLLLGANQLRRGRRCLQRRWLRGQRGLAVLAEAPQRNARPLDHGAMRPGGAWCAQVQSGALARSGRPGRASKRAACLQWSPARAQGAARAPHLGGGGAGALGADPAAEAVMGPHMLVMWSLDRRYKAVGLGKTRTNAKGNAWLSILRMDVVSGPLPLRFGFLIDAHPLKCVPAPAG
jgi:hypothetical protein